MSDKTKTENNEQELICDYCNKLTGTYVQATCTEIITKCYRCKNFPDGVK